MKTLRRVSFGLVTSALTIFIVLCSNSQGALPQKEREETYKQLEVFANVLSILQENYVEEIDTREIIESAIHGLLFSLDPHSSYLKPENFEELQQETQGSFTGIGIEITIKDGSLTVVSAIEGTPAAHAGIKANDTIVKIQGEWTKDMTPMTAIKKLRGPKGSSVTISIQRKSLSSLKEMTLVRDTIPIQSVRSIFLVPGFAYTRISNFQNKTTSEYKEALLALQDQHPIKGLILDLRNNPGGLLNQAVDIADIFVNSGIIVYTKGRTEEQNMVFNAHENSNNTSYPIVVMVNEGSASASEIVAGALQDHKRAIILGTKTFGKGSVQTIVPLPEGAGMRITTAHYFTPNGRSIQLKGVTPDVLVPFIPYSPLVESEESITREVNLKNHFSTQGMESESPQKESRELLIEKSMKKRLEKDNQLRSALNILWSLNLYSDFQQLGENE